MGRFGAVEILQYADAVEVSSECDSPIQSLGTARVVPVSARDKGEPFSLAGWIVSVLMRDSIIATIVKFFRRTKEQP